MEPLVLHLTHLGPLHIQERGYDGHQRRAPDRSGDADDSRQVVEEDGDGHA